MLKKVFIVAVLLFTFAALWGLWGDASEAWSAVRGFQWYLLPVLILFTVLSFGVRYLRWEILLARLAENPGSWDRKESLGAYLAGLAGILTPLKAGELTRSHFAKERAGVEHTKTLSIIVSERLIDGVAMILLAGFGLLVYVETADLNGNIVAATVAGLVFVCGLILVLRIRSVDKYLVRIFGKVPGVDNSDTSEDEFADAMRDVMSAPALAMSLAFGVLSWGLQAVVYMIVVMSYGESVDLDTFARSVFVYPASILIGTITLFPLGLGTADASLVFLGDLMFELTRNELIAAAVIARASIIIPALIAGFGASIRSDAKTSS